MLKELNFGRSFWTAKQARIFKIQITPCRWYNTNSTY